MKKEITEISGFEIKHIQKKVKEYNRFFWGDDPLEIFKHEYYYKEKLIGTIKEGRLGKFCRVFNKDKEIIGSSTQLALAEIRLIAYWRHHAKKRTKKKKRS